MKVRPADKRGPTHDDDDLGHKRKGPRQNCTGSQLRRYHCDNCTAILSAHCQADSIQTPTTPYVFPPVSLSSFLLTRYPDVPA